MRLLLWLMISASSPHKVFPKRVCRPVDEVQKVGHALAVRLDNARRRGPLGKGDLKEIEKMHVSCALQRIAEEHDFGTTEFV